ncbi:MAG: GH116 family glycosyl hydrolase [Chitinivibrionales bacterium]
MILKIVRRGMAMTLLAATSLWALAQTMGTPIGGMGTGYVKFNAVSGDFAASGKVPPAASDGVSEFSNKQSSSSGFHFYANGQSKTKASTANEDAKCPLYTANFGATGGVTFTLTAFGPFIPGSSPVNAQLAASPLAFFEITAVNGNASSTDVGVAMEFANQNASGTNLLGGANAGANDAAMNNAAITFAGAAAAGNAYLMADCDVSGATFSAGAMGTFTTSGLLTNGAGNLAAAKCTVPAGDTAHIKFVMAWWRTFISTVDRYGTGKPDSDNYYYHNYYPDSKTAAQFGMAHFDAVKNGASSIVNRVMASNFPAWYQDRLLNNLYPIVQNAQCAKDGRVAFWEGHYPIIGTIDQGEHAALWYCFNWPSNQWRELQYWARTSHKGVGETANLIGQIHHDFNTAPSSWTADAHFVCPWDNYLRSDYWWVPNTTDWADLNCMFIFKAYELMLATGDIDSMKIYFPYIKLTADRIITQCVSAGANVHIPSQSKSTYDGTSTITPQYASGTALTAWLAVAEMAKFVGQDSVATRFTNWYTLARADFRTICFNSSFGTGRDYAEGDVAGYSWAHYFGFPAVMDSDVIATGCDRLYAYYSPNANIRTKLGAWHFYTYDHWGGASIAIGRQDTALTIHKWDYDYYYTGNPGYVFWQDLQQTNSSYASYMTAPCVWRSYFQMTGCLLDNANKRLWIRPMVPSSMAKKITAAPIVNPRGWGTLNYNESGNAATGLCQSMTVAFDSLTAVTQFVFKNNTGATAPGVKITNSGAAVSGMTVTTEGSAYEKNVRVTLASPIQIGPQGAVIQVFNAPIAVKDIAAQQKRALLTIGDRDLRAGKAFHYTVDVSGHVSIDLIALNGARIGTLLNETIAAGRHTVLWNGKTMDGCGVGVAMAVLRLASPGGIITRIVSIGR